VVAVVVVVVAVVAVVVPLEEEVEAALDVDVTKCQERQLVSLWAPFLAACFFCSVVAIWCRTSIIWLQQQNVATQSIF
jgi:uncharacterized protein (DUF2062 family)